MGRLGRELLWVEVDCFCAAWELLLYLEFDVARQYHSTRHNGARMNDDGNALALLFCA